MKHKHHLEIKAVRPDRIRFDCKDCHYSTERSKVWLYLMITGRPMPKRKGRYE